ncbi:MAG: ABC transporter permease [Armatimonadota bacterium]|nr:ABC transporter permease [Armatimonadota bacterium]MDR7401160.1 ABC transporter permease [Armatimonadota bacterium]MDR7403420.1 ABC transporter permease [Armatimonadota bacterium]MDR7438044.1 ABC transporter permease [Armatimonadota bacterium]MDR7471815.1 ABC transporter permease [Armatimonadota bacterium]
MKAYIARRVAYSLLVMWAVATLVFFMMRAIPGDPVRALAGFEADPATVEQIRRNLGLDQPFPVQYVRWMGRLLRGDLGASIWNQQRVSVLIREALPRTLSLALLSFGVAVGLALPAGVVSAVRRYSPADHALTVLAFLGLSMPDFWLGIVLIIIFAVKLQLLPAFGYEPLSAGVGVWLSHLILPAVTTGTTFAAILARMTRSALLEVLREDYIRTARAKGLAARVVVLRHALRNALIPVLTVMGIAFALLLAGAVIAENVFAIKGVGRLLIEAILNRDFPIVQGMILVIAGIFVFTNLLVDVLYALVNPKIRYVE